MGAISSGSVTGEGCELTRQDKEEIPVLGCLPIDSLPQEWEVAMVLLQDLDLRPYSKFLVEADQKLPAPRRRLSGIWAHSQDQQVHSGNQKWTRQGMNTDLDFSASDWTTGM
jgi:hypothetical protein